MWVCDRIANLANRENALGTHMSCIEARRIRYEGYGRDIDALVRSAAVSGLKERIRRYSERARVTRKATV